MPFFTKKDFAGMEKIRNFASVRVKKEYGNETSEKITPFVAGCSVSGMSEKSG
jgi:hypothetical protein